MSTVDFSLPIIQEGPSGGGGGEIVPSWSMPADAIIVSFEVKFGNYVNQLVLHYTSNSEGDGAITLGGTDPASNHVYFPLQHGEQIQSIKGKYGSYVDSITIVTNVKTYGIFGGSGGSTSYQYDIPQTWRLIGLFGRVGKWIDAIGVIYGFGLRMTPLPKKVTGNLE
ncbi:MAG: hypothetical protein KGL95_07385 [Patescibacteria group bacterium]|nr:hypothetical protein [Patescibacteria group bacterium]